MSCLAQHHTDTHKLRKSDKMEKRSRSIGANAVSPPRLFRLIGLCNDPCGGTSGRARRAVPPRAASIDHSLMADTPTFDDGTAYERFMGRWSRAAGEAF